MNPRTYQLRAVDAVRQCLAGGAKRVMLYSPTGSGKTEIAMMMIRGAHERGNKVVFLANRKQLVAQASARLMAAGIDHGILQADNTRRIDARVLVASIDTVDRRGLPDDLGLMIVGADRKLTI